MHFIELTKEQDAILEFGEKDANDLIFEQISILLEWVEGQDIELFSGLTMQELLNLYRITYNYGDWEEWFEESPKAAVEAFNEAVDPSNKLIGKIN